MFCFTVQLFVVPTPLHRYGSPLTWPAHGDSVYASSKVMSAVSRCYDIDEVDRCTITGIELSALRADVAFYRPK